MQLKLLHSSRFPIADYAEALKRESINPGTIEGFRDIPTDDSSLRIVLLDSFLMRDGAGATIDGQTALIGVGLDDHPRWIGVETAYFHLPANPSESALISTIKRAYQYLWQKFRAEHLERQLTERTRELQEVSNVGIALSTVRDHAVLLTMILSKAREL